MKPQRKQVVRMVLVLALVVAAGAVIAWWRRQDRHAAAPAELHLYGNIDIRQIQVAFNDTGRLLRLDVQEGGRVKKGQLIAEMDPVRYRDAVAQSAAQVAAQRQVLARLLAGSRPEEIAQARAQLASTEAALRNAAQTFHRIQLLNQSRVVSRQQYDDAQAALRGAQANRDAARQVWTLAVKGPRKEDIDAARAQLHADEAALQLARRQLGDTRLYAPADGVIEDRVLEVGDMAFPQTPVYTLALTNPVWVRAYLPEPQLGMVREGTPAEIRTDSGQTYSGWVGFVSPTAQFTPKSVETTELRTQLVYQIRVYACNPDGGLRLGMPVTVAIPLDQPARVSTARPCSGKEGQQGVHGSENG